MEPLQDEMSFLFAAIRDQPFTLHSPERSLTDDAARASPSGPMGEIPRANGTFRKAAIQSGGQPGQHCNHDGPLVERPCRRLGLDSKSVAATGIRYPYAGSLRFAEAAIVQFLQLASECVHLCSIGMRLGKSTYESLQLEVTRRSGTGFTFDTSYTRACTSGDTGDNFSIPAQRWIVPDGLTAHPTFPLRALQVHADVGAKIVVRKIAPGACQARSIRRGLSAQCF